MANIGKASEDAYNQRGWLILQDLLNEWVAEGVASDVKDFTQYHNQLKLLVNIIIQVQILPQSGLVNDLKKHSDIGQKICY